MSSQTRDSHCDTLRRDFENPSRGLTSIATPRFLLRGRPGRRASRNRPISLLVFYPAKCPRRRGPQPSSQSVGGSGRGERRKGRYSRPTRESSLCSTLMMGSCEFYAAHVVDYRSRCISRLGGRMSRSLGVSRVRVGMALRASYRPHKPQTQRSCITACARQDKVWVLMRMAQQALTKADPVGAGTSKRSMRKNKSTAKKARQRKDSIHEKIADSLKRWDWVFANTPVTSTHTPVTSDNSASSSSAPHPS